VAYTVRENCREGPLFVKWKPFSFKGLSPELLFAVLDIIVVARVRDGRKLVAVVLGEQSVATRRVRATDLLENGFKRYFWKSLFGTSLDGLAIQASLTDGPAHLKDSICGVAKPKPSGTRKVSRKGGSKKRSTVSTGAN
jgi:D-alanyl-D-alanine carboxypeptidase